MTLASNGLANAIPFRFTYADATARAAASGFTSADLYSLALQLSDGTIWILTATTPTWVAAAGSGMINPMTTKGDLIVGAASGVATRQAVGTDGYQLQADSAQTLGVKWAQPALTRLDQQVLGSAAASVTIPASGTIPTGYKSLRLEAHGRMNTHNSNNFIIQLRANGDTGANYDYILYNGGSVTPVEQNYAQTALTVGYLPQDTDLANVANGIEIWIPNYLQTIWHKEFLSRGGNQFAATTGGIQSMHGVGRWRNTAAITSLTLLPAGSSGQFAAGSVFTLYGLS